MPNNGLRVNVMMRGAVAGARRGARGIDFRAPTHTLRLDSGDPERGSGSPSKSQRIGLSREKQLQGGKLE